MIILHRVNELSMGMMGRQITELHIIIDFSLFSITQCIKGFAQTNKLGFSLLVVRPVFRVYL